MNDNLSKVLNYTKPTTIIVGFSGGPDSAYLLLRLQELQPNYHFNIIAAHLDHEWRKNSENDLAWCQQFCLEKNIPFIGKKASQLLYSPTKNGSKEQQGRLLRRFFLESIASQQKNAFIALAHHQDDQIETFFIRLARGASIAGLSGMKEVDGVYLRPLLNISKNHIEKYLKQKNILYLQDPTNQDLYFLRNRIRNQLIPLLSSIDQRYKMQILATMKNFSSTNTFLDEITSQCIDNILVQDNPITLDTEQFLKLSPVIQQRIILRLLIQAKATFIPSSALFNEIIRFLKSRKHQTHRFDRFYQTVKNKGSFYIIKQ
ncbi:tRNA lysidine(34) synthetase TilS [Candidatus Dependentiae bacterium]|nr:tRNA lysidine(34) synthetase TilS [Candidatus Dependentiae bacterium]